MVVRFIDLRDPAVSMLAALLLPSQYYRVQFPQNYHTLQYHFDEPILHFSLQNEHTRLLMMWKF